HHNTHSILLPTHPPAILLCFASLFHLMTPPPPTSTVFPYTTLFRSSFISGRLATKSNQIKQLIRNGRSASLQRTLKKSFTSFNHSTRNKTRDGLIRVRRSEERRVWKDGRRWDEVVMRNE